MKEILRYLRMKYENLTPGIEEKILLIKNEFMIKCRPKSVLKEIDSLSVFNSKKLNAHFSDCKKFFLFAATLGTEADRILQRYSKTDISSAAVAQAVAAEYIEDFCDKETEKISIDGLYLKPRFSPGYGDFSLEYQKYILDYLGAEKSIGITLTDSYMMVPEKSVTAILGFTDKKICTHTKCRNCDNIGCEFRKE